MIINGMWTRPNRGVPTLHRRSLVVQYSSGKKRARRMCNKIAQRSKEYVRTYIHVPERRSNAPLSRGKPLESVVLHRPSTIKDCCHCAGTDTSWRMFVVDACQGMTSSQNSCVSCYMPGLLAFTRQPFVYGLKALKIHVANHYKTKQDITKTEILLHIYTML